MEDRDDWVDLLPFAEFGYNNIGYTVIKQTLFFPTYNKHLENNYKNPKDNSTKSNKSEAVKTVEDLYIIVTG